MRVSMKWLRELVDVPVDVHALVERLEMTGTAVEAVETVGSDLAGVVVGRIVRKERHPNADRLWVTTVDVGDGQPRTIVCGAQNFEEGDKVPVALVGATLPNGVTIERVKLRGVYSEGMNCSARELGIGEDHEGLLILPSDAPVGAGIAEVLGITDTILELEVTPNRPDCLSMVGVAREVAAILGTEVSPPDVAEVREADEAARDVCAVHIDDAELCPRYVARVIRGVRVGPSPAWLAEKVKAAGARPINNVVDVTNLVMFEMGQPLHAFDLATLGRDGSGRAAISVRVARPGERLTTLDGVERQLREDTLVIADPKGPVALAGVMGGQDTEVSEGTIDVLLESACFDPASVSRTSRSLGLVSEASMRFERIVDREGCRRAADRAAALIAEVAGGEVLAGAVDVYPAPLERRTIFLRHERLAAVIGERLPSGTAASILLSLGCDVETAAEHLVVTCPTFRPDLEREIDLIEEVLRIWGMERIEATLPAGRGRVGGLTREQALRERIGRTLRACGLNETMTYAFGDPSDLDRCGMRLAPGELLVELLNPMSSEQSVLRRSLLPGLLRSVSYNQRRGVDDIHLYEIGGVFWTAEGRKLPEERAMVAAVLAGSWHPPHWSAPSATLGFFDGKGVIENLVRELAIEDLRVRPVTVGHLQPGRSAEVLFGDRVAGWLGEVHPVVLERFEVKGPVVAFELDLDAIVAAARGSRPFVEVPRYPAVTLDVAIVVDLEVTAEQLEAAIRKAGGPLLADVRLFDVYQGPGIPPGKRSLAFSLEYRAPDRTLTGEEVERIHERVLQRVLSAVGGTLRS